jgi:hypothetical protein
MSPYNKMDDIRMKAAAAYSIEKDGEVVNSEYFQAEYDGQDLDIVGTDGDQIVFRRMSKEEIMDMLAIPAARTSLVHRLEDDYGVTMPKTRHQSRKVQKTSKSSKRKSKRRSISTHRRTSSSSQKKEKSSPRRSSRKHTTPEMENLQLTPESPIITDTPMMYR